MFIPIILYILFPYNLLFPQSFGFGCLGLVGGYGGYTYNEYKPDLLKDFVDQFNLVSTKKLNDFRKAEGYRVGVIFFRLKFSGFFFTTKGFYQQLNKSHFAQKVMRNNIEDYQFNLKFQSLAFGLDLGIPIADRLLWKIFDGSFMVNSGKFTETVTSFYGTKVNKYSNKKIDLGYLMGSGFVIDIIKNYISIEGIVAYNYLVINKMLTDDNKKFEDLIINKTQNRPFIKAGGLSATLQLNIGFPL